MSKIKVKINAPVPSLETVRSYRNFNGIMSAYKKYYTTGGIRSMLYNDRKKLVYIVIIILFLLLLLFGEEVTSDNINDKKSTPTEQID
ncbi:MAG: hypothetical protein R3345_11330 [Fulvivirga sp.]|nr:hypothetical protein [Fulvivirga sp.]